MVDSDRELAELKREVIESRNQAIKSHNQLTNLSLDVKGFEKRFDSLERRTRLASVAAHLVVALAIAGAAFVVTTMRGASLAGQIDAAKTEMAAHKAATSKEREALAGRVREMEEARRAHEEASGRVLQIIDHLEAKRDKEATELLAGARLDQLTELERKSVSARFDDLRKRAAESAYKTGKTLLGAGRSEAALAELTRVSQLDPDGRLVEQARYLEATTLYNLKRYDQAEPILRQLSDSVRERGLAEEVRFYLATALARLGKAEEAKSALRGFGGGRYANPAKLYLTALETGAPLPGTEGLAAVKKPAPAAAAPTPPPATAATP